MKILKGIKSSLVKGKALALLAFVAVSNSALASNTGLVWEKPTGIIQESISGPMAKAISIVVIVVSALGWAFTDGGSFLGKGIKIVCALAIVAGASTVLTNLFGNFSTSLVFM
ncbi:TrbC/VirB2 family protein [uncultured Fusobacterium sp.]|uniref:TrbC/VirB2 family protein n=1 Tax=uncultured Fusobacterium sp. TaxID=159267 RepID=UPI0015A67AF7|nr:TrbC/VirB2 family protein [uncultured Fusobacterium sp.]